jgi:hypothetical protein
MPKTRAEMLLNDAETKLSPRYSIGAFAASANCILWRPSVKGIQLAVHQHNLQNPEERVELRE